MAQILIAIGFGIIVWGGTLPIVAGMLAENHNPNLYLGMRLLNRKEERIVFWVPLLLGVASGIAYFHYLYQYIPLH